MTDVGLALARARELARPGTVMVVTGSIYLVGEAMRFLKLAA
jgi:folylpolyglutamate synthase/dihydropteroate synthase